MSQDDTNKSEKRPRGNPAFTPRWKHAKTRAVRIPEEFADTILDFARRLDNQTLSPEIYRAWLDKYIEETKQAIAANLTKNK